MSRVLTVKYEGSFGIRNSSTRETLATTLSVDEHDDPDAVMAKAIGFVMNTRKRLQQERGDSGDASER